MHPRGRIMYWTQSFFPVVGGIELLAAHLLPALRERGYEVQLVTSQLNDALPAREEFRGVPLFRFPFRQVLDAGQLDDLITVRNVVATLKREFRPDVVHLTFNDPSVWFHRQTRSVHPAAAVVTLQAPLAASFAQAHTLSRALLEEADWITCVSASLRRPLDRELPHLSARISVIYNSLPAAHRRATPVPVDPPRLLMLGRLAPEKGFDLGVQAFARVAAVRPEVRLWIAGDGPERARLLAMVAELKLERQVEFLGEVDPGRVPEVLDAATVVVMPSRQEGLPLVAVESLWHGRPLVATAVDGLPETLDHDRTGLLVEPENPAALAGAVLSLLDRPERLPAMGRAARELAQQKFSWPACVDAYDELYQRFLHPRAALAPEGR
jgi:glycogen(starch) synthase